MNKVNTFDVLIIGSGAAGLTLALKLPTSYKIAILSKSHSQESSTRYAQGGMATVFSQLDSFDSHVNDTLVAGCHINNKQVVQYTVKRAPECVKWLINLGVEFCKSDNQNFHLTKEGGHSHRRIFHAHDKTGLAIHKQLLDSVNIKPNISIFSHHISTQLIIKNSVCTGAKAFDCKAKTIKVFNARCIAIATGGASYLYLRSSNPEIATGDGIALAYNAGCKIDNMEFNQFHPTCLYKESMPAALVTEALRGEGARLLTPDMKRFVQKFDSRGDLAPRDVVARAMHQQMQELKSNYLYLDISFKPENFIKSHFPGVHKRCLEYGYDITKQAVPVTPAAHYTCGGIRVNINSQTEIKNLYALGETACTGLHGANRLASNSLLECFVFAFSAAESITKSLDHVSHINYQEKDSDITIIDEESVKKEIFELRKCMWDSAAIIKSDKKLEKALQTIQSIKTQIDNKYSGNVFSLSLIELRHMIVVAQLIIQQSLSRKNNIGLHYSCSNI